MALSKANVAEATVKTHFLAGVHAWADIVSAIYEQADAANLENYDRAFEVVTDGDGKHLPGVKVPTVPQWRAPVVALLRELQANPHKLEGFAAALVGFIGPTAHGSWGGDPADYFKSLSYEAIEGVRMAQQVNEARRDATFQAFLQTHCAGGAA